MNRAWFLLGIAALSLAACRKKSTSPGTAGEKGPVPVLVLPARKARVARRVRARCTIRSRTRVLVSPKVPGVLEGVFVEAGDRVQRGETLLFRSDSKGPSDALRAARAGLEAARKGVAQAEAALSAARAAEAKARLDRDRMKRLYEGASATKDAFEKALLAWETAAAQVRRAEAAVGLARARVGSAEAQVALAGKGLQDCTVRAPMDGVVTRKLMERGEMGDPGAPVLALEDPGHLEAAAFLEAALFDAVRAGKTKIRILRKGEVLFSGVISWKAPSVDPGLRVFEVRAYLPEGFSRAASGELLTMEVLLDPHEALTVPTGAVVIRKERPTVFVVRRGRARLLYLKTGVVDGERTEVLEGGLKEGEPVVVRGQAFLEENAPVLARPAGKGE